MASAEHEPIMGVWGQSLQWIHGQSCWSGGQGQSLPPAEFRGRAPGQGRPESETESFLAFERQMEVAKLPCSPYFAV